MGSQNTNMEEIRRTNQRGGRCLSIIDLIDAGTISTEAAGFCWTAIQAGSPFITGAVPGGAGKTTLMAALLGFLPPGEQIVTVKDHTVLQRIENNPPDSPVCLLAHEIGEGPWFAYIWGETAARFFSLNERNHRPVTCLHADTPEDTESILTTCGVSPEDIQSISLHLYIRNFGSMRRKHRVTRIDYRHGDDMIPIYTYDQATDELTATEKRNSLANLIEEQEGLSAETARSRWEAYNSELVQLHNESISQFGSVREKVLDVYRRQ